MDVCVSKLGKLAGASTRVNRIEMLCLSATLVAAITTAPASAQDVATAQVSQDRAFVEWQFRNLRDPDSANWRRTKDPFRTTVTLKRGILGKKEWAGELACYVLNAKNAYGAYAGYTPYAVMISDESEIYVWEGMSPSEDRTAYRSYGQQIIDNYCS